MTIAQKYSVDSVRVFADAAVRSEAGSGRTMVFVASDSTRDSAGTVLNVNGWNLDRFNKNGIIGYQHKVYGGSAGTDNPDNVIGKGHAYIESDPHGKKRLMVRVEFEPEGMNALADKVWNKLQFGTLKAVSVGFRPVGTGHFGRGSEALGASNETYYYAGQELLEVSVVNVPANPNALRRSCGVVMHLTDNDAARVEDRRRAALLSALVSISAPVGGTEPEQEKAKNKCLDAAESALSGRNR